MEHRNGQRLPLALPTRLRAGGAEAAAVILDASCSGAFVATAGRHATWAPVAIVVGGQWITARIARVAPGGCGVEWLEFAPWDVLELLEERRSFLLGTAPRRPLVRAQRTAPPAPGPATDPG